jgi:hypothetical protein
MSFFGLELFGFKAIKIGSGESKMLLKSSKVSIWRSSLIIDVNSTGNHLSVPRESKIVDKNSLFSFTFTEEMTYIPLKGDSLHKNTNCKVAFCENVAMAHTYGHQDYRRGATLANLSYKERKKIIVELKKFKLNEMAVHPESVTNLNLHDQSERKFYRQRKLKLLKKSGN